MSSITYSSGIAALAENIPLKIWFKIPLGPGVSTQRESARNHQAIQYTAQNQ